MIDVDGLKTVNDSAGHAVGDHLVRAVPAAIMVVLRSYDVTVRWGGDKFVCALQRMTIPAAQARLEEIQRELQKLHPGATISAGLAELQEADTLQSLMERADKALYGNKRA